MENTVKETIVMERTGVFDESGGKRYEMTIEYKGMEGKKILVVCMNPASNTIEVSDTTTNYIINNLGRLGCSTITICNLFAVITSKLKPSEVLDNADNIQFIVEVLQRGYDSILIGMGNTFKGNKMVEGNKEELYKVLMPFKSKLVEISNDEGLYQDLRTIHPLFAGQRFSGKWKLVKHTIPKKTRTRGGE